MTALALGLGIDVTVALTAANTEGFPTPAMVLTSTTLWRADDVRKWQQRHATNEADQPF